MSNLKFSTALRNAILDAISTYAGTGALLKIYNGTQPANANTAISGQTLLGTLTWAAALAAAASGGVLTYNSPSSDTSADATATAQFFRIFQSNGTTVVMDGDISTVAAGTGDLQMNSTAVQSGTTISSTGGTLTAPNA